MTVVQFHHPIREHNPNPGCRPPGGYMPWLHLGIGHNKKFVSANGAFVDCIDPYICQVNGNLGFWTEWEGATLYEAVRSGGKHFIQEHAPGNIHNICTEIFPSIAGFHAVADPYFFNCEGCSIPYFYYGHCNQMNILTHPGHYLSNLNPGDLILFGRLDYPRSPNCFVLDCVFVVADSSEYTPSRITRGLCLPNHYLNYVMGPLRYSVKRNYLFRLYRGFPFALRESGHCWKRMFSYFPCRQISSAGFVGFPEVTIPLDLLSSFPGISWRSGTGQMSTSESVAERNRLWDCISCHVLNSGFSLGVSAFL